MNIDPGVIFGFSAVFGVVIMAIVVAYLGDNDEP